MLGHMARQLAGCRSLDAVILATTVNPCDDAVAEYGESLGFQVFRGDEADVLSRYRDAARRYHVETVMRLTADCPLVQPEICDAVAELFISSRADHATTSQRHAEGLDCEVFGRDALEEASRLAESAPEREHVSLYIRNRPQRFRSVSLESPDDDSRYRVTVDEPCDFEVVRFIIERLHAHGSHIDFSDVKRLLAKHPAIYSLNAHVVRNEGLLKSLRASRETEGRAGS